MKPHLRRSPLANVGIVFFLSSAISHGAVITNPTVINSATAFNGSFDAGNVFDGNQNQYASAGQGANTFIELDFGSTTTFDGFVNVTRNNTADIIGDSRLIIDTDGTLGFNALTDTVVNFSAANTGSNGQGFINRFGSVTGQRVRWEVITSIGSSPNLGSIEMRFLNTAAGSTVINGVTVIGSATPFSGNYAAANAANGIAGHPQSAGVEYASASLGEATYVDFDMGAAMPITGFDFFDRLQSADHVETFDLIYSNDPTFSTTITTQSYTKGTSSWTHSATFGAINARYVRYDVTGNAPTNAGVGDMIFYTIPEPSIALLGGLGSLGLLLRRRRI